MNEIKTLTPEQISRFPFYVDKWVTIGYSTKPTDFKEAIKCAKKTYKLAGLPEPKIFLGPFNTPYESWAAQFLLKTLEGKRFKTSDDINDTVKAMVADAIKNKTLPLANCGAFAFGNQEYWLSFYDYFLQEFDLDCCKQLEGLMNMAKVCGWWIPLKNVCIFTHPPEAIHRDNQGRSHNLNGPAIKFRGDYRNCDVYVIHGIRVSKKIVDRDYTVQDIDKESNVEVRRIMIELYGQEKYLLDSNASVIHSDDFGSLYSKPLNGDEPLMMVKVVNSTPEPDGSFKDYFIRVDPRVYGGLKKAKDAVASTWRNRDGSLVFPDPSQYNPDIET